MAPEKQPRRCTLKGTVVNTVTGEGVNRALVNINGQGNISDAVLTDSEGHFSFDVPDGQLWAFTEKPGFQQSMNERSRRPISSACGSEGLTLRLEPFGVIKGKVTLEDGEPLEHAIVTASRNRIESGRRVFRQMGSAQTNEDGDFRLRDLAPGAYYISAGPMPLRELGSDKMAIPKTYFPGVTDRNAVGTVALAAGQQAEIKMSLKQVQAYNVSGRIVSNAPFAMASIDLLDSSGNEVGIPIRRRDREQFDIQGVPAGVYELRTAVYDQNSLAFGVVQISISHDISGLQLPIKPPTPIPVEFHANLSQKDPSRCCLITHQGDHVPGATVQLNSLKGLGQAFAVREGTPDKPSWVVKNAMPGKYNVQVLPNGLAYAESVRCGSTNLLAEPLTVGSGGTSDPIEISLRDDGATLAGNITGTAENPQVLAVADDRLVPFIAGVLRNGKDALRYSIEQLPPGDYTVYAFDSLENLEYMDPKVLEKYSSKAAHATLSANQKSELQLVLIEVEK